MKASDLFDRLVTEIREYLVSNLWRKIMKNYSTTYVSTSAFPSYQEEPIPDSAALRKMIDKFREYRNQLSEEKDKKEFDDFLETIRKSTGG